MHDVIGLAESPEEINDEVVRRLLARYADELPLIERRGRDGEAPRRLVPPLGRVVVEPSGDRRGAGAVGPRALLRVTVSSEEVPRGKPAPDVFLEAAPRLKVAPERCAAIEDSGNGIRAADAAGMHIIAIPNRRYPPPPEKLG